MKNLIKNIYRYIKVGNVLTLAGDYVCGGSACITFLYKNIKISLKLPYIFDP